MKSTKRPSSVFSSSAQRFRNIVPQMGYPGPASYFQGVLTDYRHDPRRPSAVFAGSPSNHTSFQNLLGERQQQTRISLELSPVITQTVEIHTGVQITNSATDNLTTSNVTPTISKLELLKKQDKIREMDPFSARNMYYRRQQEYKMSFSRSLLQATSEGIDFERGITIFGSKRKPEETDPYITTVCTNSIPTAPQIRMNGEVFSDGGGYEKQASRFRMKYEEDPQSLGPDLRGFRAAVELRRCESAAGPSRIFRPDKQNYSRLASEKSKKNNSNNNDSNDGTYLVDKDGHYVFVPPVQSLKKVQTVASNASLISKAIQEENKIRQEQQLKRSKSCLFRSKSLQNLEPLGFKDSKNKTTDEFSLALQKSLGKYQRKALDNTKKKEEEQEELKVPTFAMLPGEKEIYIQPSIKNIKDSMDTHIAFPKIDFVSDKKGQPRISSPFMLETVSGVKSKTKNKKQKGREMAASTATNPAVGPGSYDPVLPRRRSFHFNTTGSWL